MEGSYIELNVYANLKTVNQRINFRSPKSYWTNTVSKKISGQKETEFVRFEGLYDQELNKLIPFITPCRLILDLCHL